MLSVAVALIGGGGCRVHILEDFIKQLIDKERWKVLQRYIFWSMGRFNEKTESHPYIPKCFFLWETLYTKGFFFSERPWQGQHYQFVWCYIFWKSIIFYLRTLNRLLVFCVFNYKICWTSLVVFYVFCLILEW